ncbi:TIR domain containing protein [Parasponia andersonii]|uniref:ADP-ribosyl cyclase/cyclic ADP-ribose hydrolase n=1 Tax=Parasponia andersonii TaxID=3476 RepID=A0A2P5D4H9_PARAD|nr:TIR domain containing protein [Parasponia andersonii]
MDTYSSPPGPEFDVYFSFSREDPQRHIAEFASKSLVMDGIRTFKDENQVLQRGLQLGHQRKEAIQTSRIAIILLSQDYLSSDFCLEELVLILRCRERWGMIVVPIFYDLNPSDLRKVRGAVANALSRQRVGGCWWNRWKFALQEASDLCGWDHTTYIDIYKKFGNLINEVVTGLQTNDKVTLLEDCLRREQEKSAIQAQRICELKQGQEEEVGQAAQLVSNIT